MKYYERWWQENHETRRDDLTRWLAESDPTSRWALGRIVEDLADEMQAWPSVLECGPGIYLDAQIVWVAYPYIRYHAIDVTPLIVEAGKAKGLDVTVGSIEEIPHPSGAFDLVYCRHVLEHLPSYRQALSEMLRVCSRVAVAVFWRLNTEATEDCILYNTVADVPDTFHNMYSQKAITAFLQSMGIEHEWQRCQADWLLVMTPGPKRLVL